MNDDLISLAESFGMTIKTTGAESPWSNGLVERHNRVLSEMLDKIIEDSHCSLEVALAWAINAKNSLANVHGFSPYQLVLGKNPVLPAVLHDKPPALASEIDAQKYLIEHLQALHIARQAFIQAESSSKIRQALNKNVRSYSDAVYCHGDLVYCKRLDSPKWKGPASVLGKEGQQVLLKHGGRYIRVHPCRLTHVVQQAAMKKEGPEENVSGSKPYKQTLNNIQEPSGDKQKAIMCFDSDDENTLINQSNDLIDFTRDLVTVPTEAESTNQIPESAVVEPATLQPETVNIESDILPAQQQPNVKFELPSPEPIPSELNMSNNEPTPSVMPSKLSANDVIEITKPDHEAMKVKLLSRSGKVGKSGINKWSQSWNVITPSGLITSIDLKRDVTSWTYICQDITTPEQELISNEIYQAEIANDISEAKGAELDSWIKQEVYDEVEDKGQNCISVRWVITPKLVDGKMITKARLVAKGFQEVQDFRTDSPTCARESLCLMTAIVASNKWQIESIDVKTAFLQGRKLERSVFLRPPPEAKTSKVWHLRKCVYGLADAPREFYLRLRQELTNLQLQPCELDQGLFTYFSNDILSGILICHVDDILYGGTDQFCRDVIPKLENTFEIGTRNSESFVYIGISLKQSPDYSMLVNQRSFADSIKLLDIPKGRRDTEPVTEEEKQQLRAAIGQLNWISGMTRPDISFDLCQLSTNVKHTKVSDMSYANKVIKRAQMEPLYIAVPPLNLKKLHIVTYADASFNNLPESGSQGGNIIFLTDGERSTPLQWTSSRIRRVVRSTICAEALSASNACDSSLYLAKLVQTIMNKPKLTSVKCITDNKSLHDSISTSKPSSEQRLRLDISALREMKSKKEIDFRWVKGQDQLSDCLTKKGASSKTLREALSLGRLPCH